MDRDSISNTFTVALLLCIVCSVVVSATAVGLRDRQETNKLEELQRNVLVAADIYDTDQPIQDQFDSSVTTKFYRFPDGDYPGKLLTESDLKGYADKLQIDFANYNQRQASTSPSLSSELSVDEDIAGIKRRELISPVYYVQKGDSQTIVLPIRGYGLWSTLWGFVSIDEASLGGSPDAITIRGVSYYEHKETPGLGGEVDNALWKAKWPGKLIYNGDGTVGVEVAKAASGDYQVDALSGATITSQGVTNMMRYWLGESGFKSLLIPKSETPKEGE